MAGAAEHVVRLDLAQMSVREVNDLLHHRLARNGAGRIEILNPNGMHNLAVGVDAALEIDILGHGGYFVAGMNKRARITVHGSVGWSVAENIMSGTVRVHGNASECTAASGHGGLVIVEGNTSSRCGISMKGCDIVIGGDVGHVSAFMAQAGRLLVCGNAGSGLGDSLYEAVIYVRGTIQSLGADAREEPMTEEDLSIVQDLLTRSGMDYRPVEFKRVASAKTLYHWNADEPQDY